MNAPITMNQPNFKLAMMRSHRFVCERFWSSRQYRKAPFSRSSKERYLDASRFDRKTVTTRKWPQGYCLDEEAETLMYHPCKNPAWCHTYVLFRTCFQYIDSQQRRTTGFLCPVDSGAHSEIGTSKSNCLQCLGNIP